MKTKIYNLIILDASGSMSAIERQAVDGVNETVQTIREAQRVHKDQEHFVTLVSFNSIETRKTFDCMLAAEVKELSPKEYSPNGCTPLYDAMGFSIIGLQEKIEKDAKVLVTVITDGYENSSVEYDSRAIAGLVGKLKSEGWVFTYMGANQDAARAAIEMGIQNSFKFEASHAGMEHMFSKDRCCRLRLYNRLSKLSNQVSDRMSKDYFDE